MSGLQLESVSWPLFSFFLDFHFHVYFLSKTYFVGYFHLLSTTLAFIIFYWSPSAFLAQIVVIMPRAKTICDICCNEVIETETNTEDALFCEGVCQKWIHRRCAGVTR